RTEKVGVLAPTSAGCSRFCSFGEGGPQREGTEAESGKGHNLNPEDDEHFKAKMKEMPVSLKNIIRISETGKILYHLLFFLIIFRKVY
ncbi:unnamed protein product, partial [Gulo gulo]